MVLHPNKEQYDALNGYRNGVSLLEFVTDGSGRFIVGLEVLEDTDFSEIHEQLNELERIEYTPINN